MRRCAVCQVDYPDALEVCPKDGVALPRPAGGSKALHDPLIGSTIDGRYLVDSVLGEGGMGVVYAARHAIIDKRVAIKVLRREAAADESASQRFLAEAKAASKIDQQNIVDITDFGVLPDGHAYFVMEFLDGVTLARMVQLGGPLAPGAAVSIAIQVARGLGAAHSKGIIHRDLKPENIFVLDRDGISDFVKIVDFGIARDAANKKRLTVAGMVMGTPEYMAPEQASGQDTDHRVDQYALGCILYESLTGQVPFSGENAMQTLTKHVFEPPVPPSRRRPDLTIPPPLEAVVMKAMAKKRDDRFADLDELMRALQELQPTLQGIAVPLDARAALADALRHGTGVSTQSDIGLEVPMRRRWIPLAAVGGLVAAVVTAVLVLRPGPQPVTPTTPAPPVATGPKPARVTPPPVSPRTIELVVRSTPPGAEVLFGTEQMGVTPMSRTQAPDAARVHVTVRAPGYRSATYDLPADRDGAIDATLVMDVKPRGKDATMLPKPPPPDVRGENIVDPHVAPRPETKTEGKADHVDPRAEQKKRAVDELRNPF